MKIRIPYHPIHIALFLLLAFLCYQAHQFTRHLIGAILCGGFGTMTFTVSTTKEPCAFPTIVALSGPALTYGLAYAGMLLLRSRRFALFAYALVFASFAHLRWIQTLTGRGDELALAEQWFGVTSRAVVAAAVFLIGLPPIIAAYRAIANHRRGRIFAGSYLLPLLVLFVLLTGSAFLFERTDLGTQLGSLFGIWLVVLVTDLVALVVFILAAPRYLRLPQG